MSEDDKVILRLEALKMAIAVVVGGEIIPARVIPTATEYFTFLTGATNE